MKYPFLPLPFLILVVLLTINNWCSYLISTFAVSNIANSSRIIIYIPDMLLFITKLCSLVAVTLENYVNHYLIWKINFHLTQVIVVLRKSEHMLKDWDFLPYFAGKESCQRSHTSQHGHKPEILISALGTSHMFRDVLNFFGATILRC